ncbi:tetratricopeptide repeat protein [uncultured Aliiroseovarius sp.]|uniref:tetratricopeptide repeat protein n=1 Tax=uncultured Aliiroseovarius sp. TaxID=1658783 RepID=UPI0025966F17|nr:tetratricopeptide repeat protein [uncultured Aliiroseovarius sp.]
MTHRILSGIFLACALTVLAGCQTAEERAEEHFQAAIEHMENGDSARATVEFRNVFKLNGKHRDARMTYANMRRNDGDVAEAYSQYLRLVEQYPDDLEGRKALIDLALNNGNWDELRRHGEYAAKLAPDDSIVRAGLVALAYRDAVLAGNETARIKAQAEALELLSADPARPGLQRMVIDDYIRMKDWTKAREAVDTALKHEPDALDLLRKRLGILYATNDSLAVKDQLTAMVASFPKDKQILAALVQWHITRGNTDEAESLLRSRLDPQDESPEAGATLVRFLAEFRGNDAARAELDKLIADGGPHQALYRSLRASINFDTGDRDQAIAEMQSILEGAEPSDATDNVKVGLARMLDITDNPVGARALIEEVLARDPSHTEALKRRAQWLIEDDLTGDAIMTLRAALADSPNDAEIMTLMARAHERDGNTDLMSEMLALAVENSGNGVAESLRYAQHLQSVGKLRPAEDALLGALRVQRNNVQILSALGQLYIEMQDWPRTEHVARTLRGLDRDDTVEIANTLTARMLAAQNRDAELTAFLESVASADDAANSADIAIIRRLLERDETDEALAQVDQLLEATPDAPMLRFLRASILAQSGRIDAAQTLFRDLLDENDQRPEVWVALYRLHHANGDPDAARSTLASARAKLPENAELMWLEAGELEQAGDIDGAIAIYETVYGADSGNLIVANNLASLLADHRTDTESLERAFIVARRLRGTDVAPFQDTYGWIAYRLQNYDEALAHLEPAAAALQENATVQFHLAMTYAAMGRTDDALAQFDKTRAMLDPDTSSEFAAKIEAEVARLNNPEPQGNSDPGTQ